MVGASTLPLDYQWRRYGTPIVGATNSVLSFTNVPAAQEGDFTVILGNSLGSVESALATLTVTYSPPPACYPAPEGIVGWWPGNGDASDWAGSENGLLKGKAKYAPGEVDQAFCRNGSTGIFWWNDKQLRFLVGYATGGGGGAGNANFAPFPNQWYHLAVTRASMTGLLFMSTELRYALIVSR